MTKEKKCSRWSLVNTLLGLGTILLCILLIFLEFTYGKGLADKANSTSDENNSGLGYALGAVLILIYSLLALAAYVLTNGLLLGATVAVRKNGKKPQTDENVKGWIIFGGIAKIFSTAVSAFLFILVMSPVIKVIYGLLALTFLTFAVLDFIFCGKIAKAEEGEISIEIKYVSFE